MSLEKGSSSGMDVILELDNWSTFDMAFKEYAIGFEDAGTMLATGVAPVFVEPEFNTVSGGGVRLYDDQAAYGRSMWIDDRRSIHNKRERFFCDNQTLLAKLLTSLSSVVPDKLRTESTYKALRNAQDLLGIYKLLEKQGMTRGAGVHSVTAASI